MLRREEVPSKVRGRGGCTLIKEGREVNSRRISGSPVREILQKTGGDRGACERGLGARTKGGVYWI